MSGTQLSATGAFTLAHILANGSSALDAEVAAFDALTGLILVAGPTGIDALDPATGTILGSLDTTAFGNVNSVAARDGVVGIALEAVPKTDPGKVVILDITRSGDVVIFTPRSFGGDEFVTVGALPDQIGFTPDGTRLITANEGEPNSYGQPDSVDPEGSVSIIDVATGAVSTATFGVFNAQADALKAAGVRLFGPGATVAQDLEPEYVAVDPNDPDTAYVTLQENNAIAVLDIPSATITAIVPLGYKDHALPGNEISANDRDNVFDPISAPVLGMYQPDAIAAVDFGGTTYLITANEGDARDYDGFAEEARVGDAAYLLDPTAFPDAATLKLEGELGRLTVTNATGDTDGDGDFDAIYAFGGRSFSVWQTDGTLVYDSGNMLDELVATGFPANYDENRDDNKGVEPEGLSVGRIGDDTYLFVALERADGVAAFRMDGPDDFTFTGFFTTAGDDAPEVITFIPAADAPGDVPLLVVPNEDSETTTAYALETTFTLQLLHFADAEAGLLASETAPLLAALVDAFEEDYANTLILAGGDNFIPGPFLAAGTDPTVAATHSRGNNPGAADIEIHNRIGVEASTIGNHEFDLGTNAFADAVADAAFPYLSANLDFSGDGALAGRYTETVGTGGLEEAASLAGRLVPSAVVTKGDEKIGLVGATTQILETISSTGNVEVEGFAGDGAEANDMALLAAQLQPVIDDLRAQGIDKIILMAHLQQIAFETQLAPLLEGVDIILAAGSNTRLGDATDVPVAFPGHAADFAGDYPILTTGKDGGTTLIVNTDNEFTYLGRLVVQFDQDGNILPGSLDPAVNGAYAATEANVAAAWGVSEADLAATAFAEGTKGEQVADITEAVQAVIDAKDGEVWGYTSVYLEGERSQVRNQETNLGNITADANLEAARDALGDGILLGSLKNGGGIRTAIGAVDVATGEKEPPLANPGAGKQEGGISTLDIENALRFNNRLMVFDTTAAGLKAILEHGVAVLGNQGRYPQIGGLSISYEPSNAPGARVVNVAAIDGEGRVVARLIENGAVSPDAPASISVVTLNFLAQGGDGYPIKANGENFRFLLADGTVSPAVDEALSFTDATVVPADALGEQQALKDYLVAKHPTPETAFDEADTGAAADTRLQDLAVRAEDTVFDGIVVEGTGFAEALSGTAGDDTIGAGAGADTVTAGDGADSVSAGAGADSVAAGGGADTVDGEFGNDVLLGEGGDDLLFGGLGNDTLEGGAGDDLLEGGFNDDLLVGGAGADTLRGGIGRDTLEGGTEDDLLEGGFGRDLLDGGAGADTLDGGFADDVLAGGEGDDLLLGQIGNDILRGGAGNDTLEGGIGRDTLEGGAGDDLLVGGTGPDRFLFGPGAGADTISGYSIVDKLVLVDGLGVAGYERADVDGNGRTDLTVLFDDGGSALLLDFSARFPDALVFA